MKNLIWVSLLVLSCENGEKRREVTPSEIPPGVDALIAERVRQSVPVQDAGAFASWGADLGVEHAVGNEAGLEVQFAQDLGGPAQGAPDAQVEVGRQDGQSDAGWAKACAVLDGCCKAAISLHGEENNMATIIKGICTPRLLAHTYEVCCPRPVEMQFTTADGAVLPECRAELYKIAGCP